MKNVIAGEIEYQQEFYCSGVYVDQENTLKRLFNMFMCLCIAHDTSKTFYKDLIIDAFECLEESIYSDYYSKICFSFFDYREEL